MKFQIGNQFAVGNGRNRTSFRKRNKPWNRGRGLINSPKCWGTAFKKGQKPANRVEVGTVTVRTDKNGRQRRWIKVAESGHCWVIYSNWLWEQANGPIPKGSVVHHVDGNTLNDSLGNYESMTRSRHMQHHLPEINRARDL